MASLSFSNAPAALSPREAEQQKDGASAPQGFSILKECFPEKKEQKAVPGVLEQLLGGIPSPSRNGNVFGNGVAAPNGVPFGPPAHAPMQMLAPSMPPPPPMQAAPTCQDPRWEPPRAAAPQCEAFAGSYRERLRAGGRAAFQRGFDAGFVPKSMKQDWSQMPQTTSQGVLSHPQEVQNASAVQYGDNQQMWNGAGQMQNNEYYYVPVQAPQFQQGSYSQEMAMQQPQMAMQQPQMQMLPQMAMQQPMQMMPMAQGEQSPQLSQCNVMQMPSMAMQSMPQTPTASSSGYSTPMSEVDNVRAECMAMLMPQASQFCPVDRDQLVAQLKAAAVDQSEYED